MTYSKLIRLFLFAVAPFSVFAAPVGLVLSGGGAKGAYEVGVWQTLVDSGISKDIMAISGTSVGAINAALFAAVKDPQKCAELWNEEIGGVFQFNTNLVVKILGKDGGEKIGRACAQMRKNIEEDCATEATKRGCKVTELPQEITKEIEKRCESVARKRLFLQLPKLKAFADMLYYYDESRPLEGFLPSAKLHSLIMRELPESWGRNVPAVYATALRKDKDDFSVTRFSLKKAQPEQRASMICASACIPFIFGTYEVNGATYVDGGWEDKGGDNVPLEPILNGHPEIKKVIVVYLADAERRHVNNKKIADAVGVELIPIKPSGLDGWWGVGGVFDASSDTARRLIDFGRKDAEIVLKNNGLWPNKE